MPDSAVLTFTDPDAYHAAIRDAQAQSVVTARGKFRAELVRVGLHRLGVLRGEETLPRVTNSAVDPKLHAIILKDTVDGEFTTVEDVAEAALFCAAFNSNALTGQPLVVSHGWFHGVSGSWKA
jgi:hypothetical protein